NSWQSNSPAEQWREPGARSVCCEAIDRTATTALAHGALLEIGRWLRATGDMREVPRARHTAVRRLTRAVRVPIARRARVLRPIAAGAERRNRSIRDAAGQNIVHERLLRDLVAAFVQSDGRVVQRPGLLARASGRLIVQLRHARPDHHPSGVPPGPGADPIASAFRARAQV